MHTHRPEGFVQRFPGNRNKPKIERRPLSSIGPFHEISADGHEKLAPQALKMGLDVGLPIYGYKDKYSDALLMLRVLPDCRTAAALGHVFLDFILETGCAHHFIALLLDRILKFCDPRHPTSNDD